MGQQNTDTIKDKDLWPMNESSDEMESDEPESDNNFEDIDDEDQQIHDLIGKDLKNEKKSDKNISGPSVPIPISKSINAPEAVPKVAKGGKSKNKAIPDELGPHIVDGVLWEDQDAVNSDVETMPRSEVFYRLRKPNWISDEAKYGVNEPFHFFLCLFPSLHAIQEATEKNWGAEDSAPCYAEIIRFLGIMLAMALDPIRGSRSDYWAKSSHTNNIYAARNMESVSR